MTSTISVPPPAPSRGRERECRAVRDLLARAHGGAGGVLLVDGALGSGKSRLLRYAADEASALGFSLVAGAAELTDPAAAADRMRARLRREAAAGPVLVCLDDLHRAGPATLAVLRVLPREQRRHPVAWVLARSSAPRHHSACLFGLLERDGAVRASLAPLGQDDVTALLADAFGAAPDAGLLTLAAGAAGNPALLTELAAGLREDGMVRIAGGRAWLRSSRLPGRMRHLARRHLDQLGEQARNLAVTTAPLGPSFRLEDAADMLGRPPAMLLPAVEELIAHGILAGAGDAFSFRHRLLQRAVAAATPRPASAELHRRYGQLLLGRGGSAALAADHLLRGADRGGQVALADLDAAAARMLPAAPQEAADLAVRALELTPATAKDAAARLVSAAEALSAAGRLDEAARIAVDALSGPLPALAEARLRCALSSVLCARGRARDSAAQAAMVLARPRLPADLRDRASIAYLQAVAGLRGEPADPLIAATPAVTDGRDGRVVVAALTARAMMSLGKGRVGEGLGLLRDAVRHQAGASPDARNAQPLVSLAAALVDLRLLDEADEILRAADGQTPRRAPARAALSILRARVRLARGDLADAATAGEDGLALAQSLGAHGHCAAAHSVLGVIALRRGEVAAATLHAASDGAPGPHLAEGYARAEITMARAQVSEFRDGPQVALAHIRACCADLDARPGLLLGDPATAPWLTRTALAAGHEELAVTVARVAAALAADNAGFRALDAAAAHCLGLAKQDTAALAEAAARHPDPWARASAAEDLGVSHSRLGARRAAIGQLTRAVEGYKAVGAAADAARVRRRLRKLGARHRNGPRAPGKPTAGWDSLTDTEVAVAALVARGLSNREIAGRTHVSVHTVAFYLTRIFRKLGIGSRVELTRIVIQRASPTPPRPDYQP